MPKLDISIRTAFDSYYKNAEIFITIREGVDYNKQPIVFNTKMLFGGIFIVCPAINYDDACIKTKDIVEQIQLAIKHLNDAKQIIATIKPMIKQYKKATE